MSARVTYGRRALKRRRAQDVNDNDADRKSDSAGSSPEPQARTKPPKRPRMTVEVVLPASPRSKIAASPFENERKREDSFWQEPDKWMPEPKSLRRPAPVVTASSSHASSSKMLDYDILPVHPVRKRPSNVAPQVSSAASKPARLKDAPSKAVTPFTPRAPLTRSASPVPSPPPRATYLSRTPVKTSASLPVPASSPLTPLSGTPLKRTATFPADPPSPKTPTRKGTPAKDLADLFDFLPSSSNIGAIPDHARTKPRPKAISKRMLARTRTELSFDSSNGGDSVISISSTSPQRVPSRPDTFIDLTTSSNGMTQQSLMSDESMHRPGPPNTVAPQPSIRTYAGKSRSFLVALPAGGSGLLGGMKDDDLGLEVRESYTDLRTRWGVDVSEDDPRPVSPIDSEPERSGGKKGKGKERERPKSRVMLAPGMMNDLKSITELRSKGESRRFMDEVGYLFEGMDVGVAIGVRRSSALEIVTKLCDPDFSRRAKATDFLSRAWDVLRGAGAGDGDKILDAILIFFVALAAQVPRDLQELTPKPDFVPTLWRILPSVERGKDSLQLVSSDLSDVKLKKMGVSKPEKLMLTNLASVIMNKSGLLTTDLCPPLRQLLSRILSVIAPSLHHPSSFSILYSTLLAELSLVPSRLSAYITGLSLLPDPFLSSHHDAPEFEHVEHCLAILDSFLLGRWAESEVRDSSCDEVVNGDGQEEFTQGLVSLCVACNIILRSSQYDDHVSIANKCIESALRVLINLSHENPVWCRHLLHHELTFPVVMSLITTAQYQTQRSDSDEKKFVSEMVDDEHDRDRKAQAFDRLCLTLGLLTNLVQVDNEAKDLCRETMLNPACPGSRPCARSCHCPTRIRALEALVRVYLHYRKSDPDASDPDDAGAHIVRGHLAVLFGLLMQQSPPNERIVLGALPSGTRRVRLDGLLSNAREFVGLYAEFMMRVTRGEGEERRDTEDEELGRRSDVDVAAREAASEGVAKDVIVFLEMLRDQ